MSLLINFILFLPQIYKSLAQLQKLIKEHNDQAAIDKINFAKNEVEQKDATKKFVDSL